MLLLRDLRIASHVWFIGALIFWLVPTLVFRDGLERNQLLRFFGRFVRITLLTVIVTAGLSFLKIMNAATISGFYGMLLLGSWILRNGFSATALRDWLLNIAAQMEEWYLRKAWKDTLRFRTAFLLSYRGAYTIPVMATGLVVLLLAIEVRLWWPLHDLRFAYPDAYIQLLRVREFLHDALPVSQPIVLPSVLGVVASLGAIEPMQVTRFLPPVLDILMAIAGGVAVSAVLRNNWPGVFTTFLLGCYSERSVVSDGTFGVFLFLLGVAFVAESYYNETRVGYFDALCTFALAVLSFPRTFPREVAIFIVIGCALGLIARTLHRWMPAYSLDAVLPLTIMLGIFVKSPPTFPRPLFLEYEATARQSLEIATTFPHERWAISAPTEQLAEIFGMGQFEELFRLVDEYHDRVANPQFRFPFQTLFVFVEKQPFQYFANEPDVVPFFTLSDPTYRNYRSPAGRSSLELAAMNLCDSYASAHRSQIYYEDDELKIYEFNRE